MPIVDVETIRIPEMIEHLELSGEDMVVVWDASENKTRKTPLSKIRSYIGDPSGGTYTPVQNGDAILYITPASAEGEDEILIPSIAGKNFKLLRDGYPLKPADEYAALGSGGVKLIGSQLIEGQRYEIEVFELGGGDIPVEGGSGGGFITGDVIINTNINISVSDMNKIHQVRGGSNALTITLPDVEDCPANSFLIIEALISNTKQHLITTTASQYIYRKNESTDQGLYIAKGDVLWFYRKEDGWYVISEKGNFDNLTMPMAAYKVGFNQLLCNGQLVSKTLYAKTWREVQTLGPSLVSEVTWQTASVVIDGRTVLRPYRGCFADVDADNFRLPDLMNMTLRGVKTESGSDTERHFNGAGGFQDNTNKKFWSGTITTPAILQIDGTNTEIGTDAGGANAPNIRVALPIDKTTFSTESRPDNIGVLWVLNY
jgi:hypothetical protein